MQYQVLSLDLDGTLLNSQNRITPKTKQAIWDLIDFGGVVVLASGRPTRGLWPGVELELAKRGGYLLSYNGGKITNCKTGEVIYQRTLPPELIPEIVQLSRDAGMEMISYQDRFVLLEHIDNLWIDREAAVNHMEYKEVQDLAEYITFPVVKLMAVGDPEKMEKAEKAARERVGGRVDIYRSEKFHLEFVPKGIDKAASLEALLCHLGMTRENLVACGDSYNDISMVGYAGLGVAMGNAIPEVKNAAAYITGSNDEDGIASVIYKFMLPNRES